MADQKNDDTKTPFARRGPRPFGGPPNASVPSRPFTRPTTAQRPTAAPFVAPIASGKLVLRNATPTPSAKAPTPIATPLIPPAEIETTPAAANQVASEIRALDAIDAFDAVWDVSEPPARPVEPGVVAPVAPVAPLLDDLSLGSGIDAQQVWAEDITANDAPPAESEAVAAPVTFEPSPAAAASAPPTSSTPAWLDDDAAPPAVPTPDPVESEINAAVDDVPALPTAAQPASDVGGGYGFGEWTDSHTIPAFDEIMGALPEQPVTAAALEPLGDTPHAQDAWTVAEVPASPPPSARFELVEVNQEPQPEVNREEPGPENLSAAAAAKTYSPHEARIAAAFDRLADRVRSGEIDVSSIAPEATDAAVLASVLAALLGGSRSR